MSDNLRQKQIFLRENILDKGFNADDFMGFLQSKKGDLGLDLNNWSMEELNSTVNEFIGIMYQDTNNNYRNGNIKMNNQNENYNNSQNINENYNKEQLEQEYLNQQLKLLKRQIDFVPCSVSETTNISKTSGIQIKLTFPEKIEGGIFTKSYISYLLETNPFGFKVRKRYSDFEWLRNTLSTQYINCVIPPLCKKNYTDRFSEHLIFKRTRLLQKFMEGLLIHPLIRNSKILYDFISTEKEEDFELKKRSYGKIESPITTKEVKSLNGQITVSISEDKEIYFDNIKDNADINGNLMKKITSAYKELINLMKQVSTKMKDISGLWKNLYTKSQKYFETNNTSESYNLMSNVMNGLSDIENKKIELINKNLREYFRFVKNEFISLKGLSSKVDMNKDIYTKAIEKLIQTKEDLFKSQDFDSWGLNKNDLQFKEIILKNKNLALSKMLPEETQKVDEIKYLYGLYLNSTISEYERLRLLNSRRHKDNISRFIKMLADTFTHFHINLVDQITNYDNLKDEEDLAYDQGNGDNYDYY